MVYANGVNEKYVSETSAKSSSRPMDTAKANASGGAQWGPPPEPKATWVGLMRSAGSPAGTARRRACASSLGLCALRAALALAGPPGEGARRGGGLRACARVRGRLAALFTTQAAAELDSMHTFPLTTFSIDHIQPSRIKMVWIGMAHPVSGKASSPALLAAAPCGFAAVATSRAKPCSAGKLSVSLG